MMSAPVVVTGVTSFVGVHLARDNAAHGRRVIAVTRRPIAEYEGTRERRLKLLDGMVEFAQVDLTDADAVRGFIDRVRPALWLHHAGYADAYASLDYDLATGLRMNVVALTEMYSALAGNGCAVIVTGSSAEYSASDAANVETDACWPDSPYGIAKLAETLRARQLAERYGVPTRVARLYIPFGPLDSPEKLLALVVRGLRSGTPIDLSPCTQQRDFLGITDVCLAYRALEDDCSRTIFDVFNVCGGQAIPLREFLLSIAAKMNADTSLLRFGKRPMRAGEAERSFGSNDKIKRLLAWRPTELATAIERDLLADTQPAVPGLR